MAFSDSLSAYEAKAKTADFKTRLRSALMKQSRYFIEATAAGLSLTDERMADIHDYSRRVRYLIWSDNWLWSAGMHILWSVGSEDVDDDTDLDALVTSKYLQLSESVLAA